MRRWLVMAAVLLTLGACGDGEPPGQPPPDEAGPDFAGAVLWLSFDEASTTDDGTTQYADAHGAPYTGLVVQARGGEVRQVPGTEGRGSALQFPAPCDDPTGCPRALVEVAHAETLDPGAEAFSFGASVQLSASETTDGSNVVQQGRFASPGGQWKLQVDGEEGRPSCLVRGSDGAVVVESTVAVADDAWHRVVCHRDAEGVSIAVDGTVDRAAGETGPLASGEPVRIGSPGVAEDDDQFSGRIDDVFLHLGADAPVE
jgi:hypothetical protein